MEIMETSRYNSPQRLNLRQDVGDKFNQILNVSHSPSASRSIVKNNTNSFLTASNGSAQIISDNEKNNGREHSVTKTMVLITPASEWTKFLILLNRTFVRLYRDWVSVRTNESNAMKELIGMVFYVVDGDTC